MNEYVCTANQMRDVDKIASEKFCIPSIVLMENAAGACVREIEGFDSFAIICGKGNNGGDGLAMARKLTNLGKTVNVYSVLGTDFEGDASVNFEILKSMGVSVKTDLKEMSEDIRRADCTVDAIFGTGIRGTVLSPAREAIEAINNNARYVLSVDVPSGVNSDTGEAEIAVRADKTVTFAAYKRGLFLFPGADFAGRTVLADISIPEVAFIGEKSKIKALSGNYINTLVPKRENNSHKGDYGKLLVIGGSVGMAGAVAMACDAAFKAGVGTVTACVPYEINDIIQTVSINTMTRPADFKTDADEVASIINSYDAVLFGNGIGREEYIVTLLGKILQKAEIPVVIDADGLYALSKDTDMLNGCKSDAILTPHTAEMARLTGKTVDEIERNRFSVTADFALKYKLTPVLKGKHSIITAPDGVQSVNTTGNPGMATAGSGDVLAGITAAFAARGLKPYNAAELAVYLHGAAGDRAAETFSAESLTALDIISEISRIFPVEKTKKV